MNEEIIVHPLAAIRVFAQTFIVLGDHLLTDRKYKKTREAWATAMYLLGLGGLDGNEWWLSPEADREQSPDFNCYTFTRSPNNSYTVRTHRKVEVFDWRKDDPDSDFITALKRIKLDKLVDPELTVVCHIRRKTHLKPFSELAVEIGKIKPLVKEVWVVASLDQAESTWIVGCVYPNPSGVTLDYEKVLSAKEQVTFLYGYRGKSDELEYESTGKIIELTPDFRIEVKEEQNG